MSTDRWVDVLQPRRHTSDFLWLSFHNWICSELKHSEKRSPAEIRDAVLQEPAVKALLRSDPSLSKKVASILEEMAHTWSIKSIRFVGYFLTKIMKSVYRNVWVSDYIATNPKSYYFNGCSSNSINSVINGIAKDCPILYMPTHRSYADFLLFSYVCFHFNLPLPSIAAGNDFLSLNQVASLLRACGAFFIRRSFRNDQLYWHVFRAYIQTQIRGGERPIEFFVEGTRSRSGKFLYPKIGLLSVALELYLTAQITDLVIIPVSISYDRTLEEQLYAKELAPPSAENQASGTKPKETTQHLLHGARSVLSDDYGSVYIRFGEPISVKEFAGKNDVRKSFSMIPRDTMAPLFSTENVDFINKLATNVVCKQRSLLVISSFNVFSLCAFSEIYTRATLGLQDNIVKFNVSQTVELITEVARAIDRNCLSYFIFSRVLKDELIDFCLLHHKFIDVLDGETIAIDAGSVLVLSQIRHYSNHALQLVVELAIACMSYSFQEFSLIQELLSREFVFPEIGVREEYEHFNKMKNTFSPKVVSVLAASASYYVKEYLRVLHYFSTPDLDFPPLKPLIRNLHTQLKVPLDVAQNSTQLLHDKQILSKATDSTLVNFKSLDEFRSQVESAFCIRNASGLISEIPTNTDLRAKL